MAMILPYKTPPICVGEFNYRLGSFKWDLTTLKPRVFRATGKCRVRELHTVPTSIFCGRRIHLIQGGRADGGLGGT